MYIWDFQLDVMIPKLEWQEPLHFFLIEINPIKMKKVKYCKFKREDMKGFQMRVFLECTSSPIQNFWWLLILLSSVAHWGTKKELFKFWMDRISELTHSWKFWVFKTTSKLIAELLCVFCVICTLSCTSYKWMRWTSVSSEEILKIILTFLNVY